MGENAEQTWNVSLLPFPGASDAMHQQVARPSATLGEDGEAQPACALTEMGACLWHQALQVTFFKWNSAC